MKYALYARVSTGKQDTEVQLQAMRKWVEGRDDIESVVEYVDIGISGARKERPALDKLMKEAQRRKFGCVVVWKFDRFARSVTHLCETLEFFNGQKIQFVSITEAIDTNTVMGRMVFTIIAAIAEFERGILRERTMAGLERAHAKGRFGGHPRKVFDRAAAAAYYAECGSLNKTAKKFKVSNTALRTAGIRRPKEEADDHTQEIPLHLGDVANEASLG